jgi:hypothetical protein
VCIDREDERPSGSVSDEPDGYDIHAGTRVLVQDVQWLALHDTQFMAIKVHILEGGDLLIAHHPPADSHDLRPCRATRAENAASDAAPSSF